MEIFSELYYGMWAQLSLLPQIARAAIVLGILLISFWMFLVLFLPRIFALLFIVFNKIFKLFYLLFSDYVLPIFLRKKYIYCANSFSRIMEKRSDYINNIVLRLRSKRKRHVGKFVILYATVLFLIYLPNLSSEIISDDYTEIISYVSKKYSEFEKNPMQKAEKYNPIFVSNSKSSDKESEKTAKLKVNENVNFRVGPGISYNSMDVLPKGTIIYMVGENTDSDWCKVKTIEGKEGWVHKDYIDIIEE